MAMENQTYQYFVSYMYIDPMNNIKLSNASVTRTGPISSYEDIKEIQKDIDVEIQMRNVVIISYQLLNINKEAYLT